MQMYLLVVREKYKDVHITDAFRKRYPQPYYVAKQTINSYKIIGEPKYCRFVNSEDFTIVGTTHYRTVEETLENLYPEYLI